MSRSETTFPKLLRSDLLQRTIQKYFGSSLIEVIHRPKSFVIHRQRENGDRVVRIVVLPPRGCTSDRAVLLNPHPEARTAKTFIYGTIEPSKKGYKPVVRGIELRYSKIRNFPTQLQTPYAIYKSRLCDKVRKSWKNWFYVVKENGWGNFHSLVNLTSTWVVLVIEKQLLDQKPIRIGELLKNLTKKQANTLQKDLQFITSNGDEVFTHPAIIQRIVKLPLSVITPILVQMLNVQETGKHQNCTFFALLLKLAHRDRVYVRDVIKDAHTRKTAPHYYLADLQKKML